MSASPSVPFDLPAAWSGVGRFLQRLTARFGRAGSFAHAALPARMRRDLAAWLDAAESLLRRLLLIEAQRLPAPPAPTVSAARAPLPRTTAQEALAPPLAYAPAEQRLPDQVMFRLMPPALYGVQREDRRPRAPSRRSNPTLTLARRLRAIAGVFEDPEFYIRRMAAKLPRAPSLTPRIQTAPLDAHLIPTPLRTAIYDGAWLPPVIAADTS